MAILRSLYQCGITIIILHVEIASAGNQQLTYCLMTFIRSQYQCGLTIHILHVDIASAGNQQLTYCLMTFPRSQYQCGRTILPLTVLVNPLIQALFDVRNVSIIRRIEKVLQNKRESVRNDT